MDNHHSNDHMTLDDAPRFLKPSEIAGILRINVRTIQRQLKSGSIPGAVRLGNSWRVNAKTFYNFLDDVTGSDTICQPMKVKSTKGQGAANGKPTSVSEVNASGRVAKLPMNNQLNSIFNAG